MSENLIQTQNEILLQNTAVNDNVQAWGECQHDIFKQSSFNKPYIINLTG